MDLDHLIHKLKRQLDDPLPGLRSQLGLFSEKAIEDYYARIHAYENVNNDKVARQSSVLVLLYEKEGNIFIPLIKRQVYDGVHSGQIALPGGKVELDDKDIVATALREANEEIGITKDDVVLMGTLTPVFIPPSNFWVNVVLAYTKTIPQFKIDSYEVAELIEFPLSLLKQDTSIEERDVMGSSSWRMKAPGYVYEKHFVWGATSMILSELRFLIKY